MLEQQMLTIVMPLLLLVVLKLCDIAREIDLHNAPEGGSWATSKKRDENAPFASPFTLIHGVNYLILVHLFVGISDSYQGKLLTDLFLSNPQDVYFYLAVVTLLLWFFLPIFEVRDYQQVVKTSPFSIPYSLLFHFIIVGLSVIVIRVTEPFRTILPHSEGIVNSYISSLQILFTNPMLFISSVIIELLIGFLTIIGMLAFVGQLDDELNERTDWGTN